MTRFLDVETWPRKAAFEFFRGYDLPFFNVCATLEAGALVELARSPALSFTIACHYLAIRVANECEPFRYRLSEGRVLVHDVLHVGTTALLDGDRLAFMYVEYDPDFTTFQERARQARSALETSTEPMDGRPERTDLVHFTAIPWISFTSVSHARNLGREDSVPKITFGRYRRTAEGTGLPLSVEAHHALMDGVHVARYYERLQGYLENPATALGLA